MSELILQPQLLTAAISAFLIGLSFGSGPCNLSCLPYLAPVLMGPAANKPFHAVLLPFMGGRLLGYTLLGSLASIAGLVLQQWLEHPLLPWLIAAVTFWLALRLILQSRNQGCTEHSSAPLPVDNNKIIATDRQPEKTANRWQLGALGFSLAMNPCVPLLGVLAASAQSGDPLWGVSVALSFGAGAVIIPSLIVRYGVALLGKELRQQLSRWQLALSRTGAVMLMLVAVNTAFRGVLS